MNLRKPTLVVKALILTAAVAATTVGVAAPASAGQNVSAQIDFGALDTDVYGAFHHQGDWVQLVDSCKDKAVSYIQVHNGAGTWTYEVAKKGEPNRCGTRWINRNFPEGSSVGIRVCIRVAFSRDTCSTRPPGFRWGIA